MMSKSILNTDGIQKLTKKQQAVLFGGVDKTKIKAPRTCGSAKGGAVAAMKALK